MEYPFNNQRDLWHHQSQPLGGSALSLPSAVDLTVSFTLISDQFRSSYIMSGNSDQGPQEDRAVVLLTVELFQVFVLSELQTTSNQTHPSHSHCFCLGFFCSRHSLFLPSLLPARAKQCVLCLTFGELCRGVCVCVCLSQVECAQKGECSIFVCSIRLLRNKKKKTYKQAKSLTGPDNTTLTSSLESI